MTNLWQDLRYSTRMWLKAPGFTTIAVLTLALGIAANTTVFSLADALILHPFNFPRQQRITMVWERNQLAGYDHGAVAPGNFSDWLEQNQTFEQLAAIEHRFFVLTGVPQPERYGGYGVSLNFFDTLGVRAALGRTFQPSDDEPGRNQVVVLKHSMWQRHFASDPNIVGRILTLNGKAFTVIGVMPPEFNFPSNIGELWSPIGFDQVVKRNRDDHYLQVVGLLKPGVSIMQAEADLNVISRRAQQLFPETNAGLVVNVVDMNKDFARHAQWYVSVLAGTVTFVLLIACANVANMLLGSALTRQKEIAVRLALGASRWRMFRQMLTESLLLALAGGVTGLLLSFWAVKLLRDGMPEDFAKLIPGFGYLGVNRAVLLFTLAVSMLTGILFGSVPAWQSSRLDINSILKEGVKSDSLGGSRHRFRSALVVTEVALSLVLLIGAGLMIRSFVAMLRDDIGFNPNQVLSFQIGLPEEKYPREKCRSFYDQLLKRLESLPGVVAAGAIDILPMSGGGTNSSFEVIGRAPFEKNNEPHVNMYVVASGYFRAIDVQLRRGRDFSTGDNERASGVAIVNEVFARRFFQNQEVIGQKVKLSALGDESLEIIGVIGDIKNNDLDRLPSPSCYVPHAQYPQSGMGIVVRSGSDPMALAAATRNEVMALDPTQPVSNLKTIAQVIHERTSPKRVMTVMMGVLAGIALLLAAVGIYAVMYSVVSQRTYEVGVRLTLGAQGHDILRLITGQGLKLIVIGLVLGTAGAVALTRIMSPFLYGIAATDPQTFILTPLLLTSIAMLACWIPSRRAAKVDPMVALRRK
jgi:putative ABC transport system permease protein